MVETDGLSCGEQMGRTKGEVGAWAPRGLPHEQGWTGSTDQPWGLRTETVVGGELGGLPRRDVERDPRRAAGGKGDEESRRSSGGGTRPGGQWAQPQR